MTVTAAIAGWLLYLLWQSRNRDSLSIYGAFALPAVIVVAGWVVWAWRKGKAARPADAASGEALNHAADQLAVAVQAQWRQAAEEWGLTGADPVRITWSRPSLPLAGPASAATESHRFAPLPGMAETREADLASGQSADLHALYGGLRSGRLIIAGPPGSGKTGAAVVLVLDALRYREQASDDQRPLVPVPVLFTAQNWNPQHQPAMEWLTGKLQDTYPLFDAPVGAETAAALLASGKITVILDGLDEISPGLRPEALQALSQQATFRLVILSRTSEIAVAVASPGILQGAAAIELAPVSPADAASYLQRVQLDPPPADWQELTRRIRAHPSSALSTALNNPLALTLVRDTYQSADSISGLLEFCETLNGLPTDQAAEVITGRLLDRVLPAAYAHSPGQPPPPYDLATAQRVLERIAVQMNSECTRDLNWWQIPNWVPNAPRVRTARLVFGLAGGLAGGLVFGLAGGLVFGLAAAPGAGLLVGSAAGAAAGRDVMGRDRPRLVGSFRLSKALSPGRLVIGLLAGGFSAGIPAGLVSGVAVGVGVWLTVGLTLGPLLGLGEALAADSDNYSSLNPVASWRGNRTYGMIVGLMVGLASGLALGLAFGVALGLRFGLATGLLAVLMLGLEAGLFHNDTWVTLLASAQLATEWDARIHLMRFLNDAYARKVLRAVGPSYQFRHAHLQDRFAIARVHRLIGSTSVSERALWLAVQQRSTATDAGTGTLQ